MIQAEITTIRGTATDLIFDPSINTTLCVLVYMKIMQPLGNKLYCSFKAICNYQLRFNYGILYIRARKFRNQGCK